VLGPLHQGLQSVLPLTEHRALVSKGNLLFHGGPDPKELAYFIEGTAEARGRGDTSEPTHGIVPLFDATVVLLESIVEIAVAAMSDLTVVLQEIREECWRRAISLSCSA
jgi:hypothetical protein